MGGGHIMVRSFDRRQGTIFDGAELNTIGDRNFVVPATGEPALVKPRGAVTRVGDTDASDVGNYAIHFPVQTGFASVAFRPQLWVDGYPSFDHNPHAPSSLIASDEAVRPHVLTMHAWGAQGGDGGASGNNGQGGFSFAVYDRDPTDGFFATLNQNTLMSGTAGAGGGADGAAGESGTRNWQ